MLYLFEVKKVTITDSKIATTLSLYKDQIILAAYKIRCF